MGIVIPQAKILLVLLVPTQWCDMSGFSLARKHQHTKDPQSFGRTTYFVHFSNLHPGSCSHPTGYTREASANGSAHSELAR